jgi:hypothetical protein
LLVLPKKVLRTVHFHSEGFIVHWMQHTVAIINIFLWMDFYLFHMFSGTKLNISLVTVDEFR